MSSTDIYGSWPFGMAEGLAFREGLYNNANEIEYLTKIFDRTFVNKTVYRKIEWNTVDFDTAEIVRFNENEEWTTIPSKIVASTSMPFAFPHMHMDGHCYVDGGTVWNVDFISGINRCLNDGYSEKDIIVDIILCSGQQRTALKYDNSYNTIHNYMRYRDIKSYYTSMGDVEEVMRGFPKANFRYLVVPKEPLPSGYIPLGFKHDDIVKMMEIGYNDGKDVIRQGEGVSFRQANGFYKHLQGTYNPQQTLKFLANEN